MSHEEMFLTAAIAASVALGAPQVRADNLGTPDERAFYIAEHQGADALRQFVQRTRMIYALDTADYPAFAPEPAAADVEPEAAGAPPASDADRAAAALREQIDRDMQHD